MPPQCHDFKALSGRNSCQTLEPASPAHDLPAINNGDTHACRAGRRGSHAARCTSEAAFTDLTVVDELQQLRGACGGLHAGPGLSARWACCPVLTPQINPPPHSSNPAWCQDAEECGRSGQEQPRQFRFPPLAQSPAKDVDWCWTYSLGSEVKHHAAISQPFLSRGEERGQQRNHPHEEGACQPLQPPV